MSLEISTLEEYRMYRKFKDDDKFWDELYKSGSGKISLDDLPEEKRRTFFQYFGYVSSTGHLDRTLQAYLYESQCNKTQEEFVRFTTTIPVRANMYLEYVASFLGLTRTRLINEMLVALSYDLIELFGRGSSDEEIAQELGLDDLAAKFAQLEKSDADESKEKISESKKQR